MTGATGFIGSHLTEIMVEQGYNVIAFDRYNSNNNWGWLEDIESRDNIEIVSGDIRDPYFCKEITKDIDVIYHLAALIGIPYSYLAPDSYVDTNIKGTVNICQAAKENQVKRIIHTSTSEVYGTAQYVPIDEKHPLQAQSPYSASKIGADAMALSFFKAFNLPVTIARPFNTYGPRQSARAIIPTIISQILNGKSEIELGSLYPTRDLTFVKDTCAGFEEIYKSEILFGEVTNIGMKTEISIGELTKLIAKTMNVEVTIKSSAERIRPENSEVERLFCDNAKLLKHTSWKPNYTLEQGIGEVIEWMKKTENLNYFKSDRYNV